MQNSSNLHSRFLRHFNINFLKMRFSFLLSVLVLAASYGSIQSQLSAQSTAGMQISWRDATVTSDGDAVEFTVTNQFTDSATAKANWIAIGLSATQNMAARSNVMLCIPPGAADLNSDVKASSVTHAYVPTNNASPKLFVNYGFGSLTPTGITVSSVTEVGGLVTCTFKRLKAFPGITGNADKYLTADASNTDYFLLTAWGALANEKSDNPAIDSSLMSKFTVITEF